MSTMMYNNIQIYVPQIILHISPQKLHFGNQNKVRAVQYQIEPRTLYALYYKYVKLIQVSGFKLEIFTGKVCVLQHKHENLLDHENQRLFSTELRGL